MISASPDTLQKRAETWSIKLGLGEVIPSQSTVGGGSLPEETIPTYVLALPVRSPNRFMGLLRQCRPPLIGRLEADKVIFDPRTVLEGQDHELLAAIRISLDNS
jgi:L-seryl-tRNA(Ser) seleniumtransferase